MAKAVKKAAKNERVPPSADPTNSLLVSVIIALLAVLVYLNHDVILGGLENVFSDGDAAAHTHGDMIKPPPASDKKRYSNAKPGDETSDPDCEKRKKKVCA